MSSLFLFIVFISFFLRNWRWLDFLNTPHICSWKRFAFFGWLLLRHWCFLLRFSAAFWSLTFPCFEDLADNLWYCFFFFLRGSGTIGRSVLKVSFLVEVQAAKYRLHHLWKAYAASCYALNLSFLLDEIRCFDRRHRRSRSINDQVLFALDALVPRVIESNFGSVRASFMIW